MKEKEKEIRIPRFICVHDDLTEEPIYVRAERIVEFFENYVLVRGQEEDYGLDVLETCAEIAEEIRDAESPYLMTVPMQTPYPDPYNPTVTWDPYNPTVTRASGTGCASRETRFDDGR